MWRRGAAAMGRAPHSGRRWGGLLTFAAMGSGGGPWRPWRAGGWQWGGQRTFASMGSGDDGKGCGGGRVAKSLQSKQYMVSTLERMRVRTQHMARVVSKDSAGLQTLAVRSTKVQALLTKHHGPITMVQSLWAKHYGPSTMVQALLSNHYRPSTMVQSQRTKHYGPITTDQSLRTKHYGPSTTV